MYNKDIISIASKEISKRYTPTKGISIEEIADFLLSELDTCEDGHENEINPDMGKFYINGKLNATAFNNWLDWYTSTGSFNTFDQIEEFLLHN